MKNNFGFDAFAIARDTFYYPTKTDYIIGVKQ